MEEPAEQVLRLLGQLCFLERALHQRHPAIAGPLIELERHMPHPQPRVAPLLDISLRSAEAADEKVLQPLFRASQIIGRIHRAENVVARHLGVKRPDQPLEAVFTNLLVDLSLGNHRYPSMITRWTMHRRAPSSWRWSG